MGARRPLCRLIPAALAAATGLGVSAAVPAPALAADSTQGVIFFSIRVAPDYASSHVVYAAGSQLSCRSSCDRLFRSADGGHSWHLAAARGWSNGDAWPATTSRGPVLLAPGPSSMQESWDGGESFSTVSLPAGAADVTSAGSGGGRAVVVDQQDGWHVEGLADLSVQSVPGGSGSLRSGNGVYLVDGSGGLAYGTGTSNGHAEVERCDAGWHCDSPSDVAGTSDLIRVQPSPAYGSDHAVFARSLQHGTLYRSTDSAHSFNEVTVAPPVSSSVETSVQGLAFSADFHATAPRGRAFAAVIAVQQQAGGGGSSSGGVFASSDGGSSWRHLGSSSALDHGSIAVAATPDGHVLAAYFDAQSHTAGLLCTGDGRSWSASCPVGAGTAAGGGTQSSSGAGRSGSGGAGTTAAATSGASTDASSATSAQSRGGGAEAGAAKASSSGGGGGAVAAVAIAVIVVVLGGAGAYLWRRRRAPASGPA